MPCRRLRGGFWWLAAVLLVSGCGSMLGGSPQSDPQIEELRQRLLEAQREARVHEVESSRLKQRLAELEAELRAARQQPRETPAGKIIETQVYEPPSSLGGSGIEESDLEAPRVAPTAELPSTMPTPQTGAPQTERPETPLGAQRLYDEGYTQFHENDYAAAERRFRRYLELYPDTELADNAQFWVGECLYARGDYGAALEAFTATVDRYPSGNKVPDALVKAGKSLEALGEADRARLTYREVVRRFPGSGAAAIALERIEALR